MCIRIKQQQIGLIKLGYFISTSQLAELGIPIASHDVRSFCATNADGAESVKERRTQSQRERGRQPRNGTRTPAANGVRRESFVANARSAVRPRVAYLTRMPIATESRCWYWNNSIILSVETQTPPPPTSTCLTNDSELSDLIGF